LLAQKLSTVLFANIEANNQVLELDIPATYDGTYLLLGVVKNDQVSAANFVVRGGKHVYDLRQIPEWNGSIDYLATNLPKRTFISQRLIKPSMGSEWDMFMEVESLSPRTVNFTKPKTLFGFNFTIILSVVAILFSIIGYFILKLSLPFALLGGVILSFILMDARFMLDRWRIVDKVESTFPYVEPLTFAQQFIEKAKPLIGNNTWSFQGDFKDDYFRMFFQYSMADIPYKLNWRNNASAGTFIITEKPVENQKILLQENGFYLVKQL